jgi:hypothetical protein
MNLKTVLASFTLCLSAFATNAHAQWVGTSVGFGGSYSNTTVSGSMGNGSITTTTIGGGFGVGVGGYYGGCGPYYGGYVAPAPLPYYGYAPVYTPYYAPYYAAPCYRPPVVYGGYGYGGYGCGVRRWR